MKRTLACDIEIYRNYLLIAFMDVATGKIVSFEKSDRSDLDYDRIRTIMRTCSIVTFNGASFDIPLIYLALGGASVAEIKAAADRIINERLRWWDAPRELGVFIPRDLDHVDLIEPNPAVMQGLKVLNGRLHGPRMQDLPYPPDAVLAHDEMDLVTEYCGNDLDATARLFRALEEPLALRAELSDEYGVDFMSKSDSQIGEGIVKKIYEKNTGSRPPRPTVRRGHTFRYTPPKFLNFRNPQLRDLLSRIQDTDFRVKADGKVDLPSWLKNTKINIGGTEFAMGIGGLHSTESNRAVHADEHNAMVDVDVTGFYPQIIINSKMYPPAIGPAFCDIYASIKRERDTLKPKLKDKTLSKEVLAKIKAGVEGRKIVGNGVFGKTSSPWSTLYAPELMIYTTLTGQLSILMLIDRIVFDGMLVVSANTDGVVILCPRSKWEGLSGDRFAGGRIKEVVESWESETGFNLEAVEYRSIYNLSVNTYFAIKEDGTAKRKGTLSNPWADGDLRGQMMKNPNMTICSDAALKWITDGTPIEETIRGSRDITGFVTVVNVKGGGKWREEPIGKVVRYAWVKGGEPIYYVTPHESTGNFKKVSRTDGCRPLMNLPDTFPDDIDFDRYVSEAYAILRDVGALGPVNAANDNNWARWQLIAAGLV